MFDIFKRGVYAGIGAVIVTKETVEKSLSELVDKGRITAEEARQTADKLVEDGKKEFEKAQEDAGSTYDSLLSKAHIVTRSEYEKLAARVAALEALNTPQPDPAAPEQPAG